TLFRSGLSSRRQSSPTPCKLSASILFCIVPAVRGRLCGYPIVFLGPVTKIDELAAFGAERPVGKLLVPCHRGFALGAFKFNGLCHVESFKPLQASLLRSSPGRSTWCVDLPPGGSVHQALYH